MVKVALNTIDGTFNLSKIGYTWLITHKGWFFSGYLPTEAEVTTELTRVTTLLAQKDLVITTSYTGEGTITLSNSTPKTGDDVTVSIVPGTGYYISSVLVDGEERGSVSLIKLNSLSVNHTIAITFTLKPDIITPAIITAMTEGGVITTPGTHYVEAGTNYIVALRPSDGYTVDYIMVDAIEIISPVYNADGSYTTQFTNITENHTVFVAFKKIDASVLVTDSVKIIYEDKYGQWQTNVDDRTDVDRIACIEALGTVANGDYAVLEVATVPDTVSKWYVKRNCKGGEVVTESYNTWG